MTDKEIERILKIQTKGLFTRNLKDNEKFAEIKNYNEKKFFEDILDYINRLKEARNSAVQSFTKMETLYKVKCNELELAETQLKELLSALYQRTDNEKGFTLYRSDILELAKDYDIKEEELK